tara:strand:+ start:24384 stop:25241 length:858 start_codon:yes stop_codon:yes gene_type:complete
MQTQLILTPISSFAPINTAYAIYNGTKNLLKAGLKLNQAILLKRLKRSDTLVVLGAGDSLNSVSVKTWEQLSTFDTAGLSYSVLLPIPLTYYFLETASRSRVEAMQLEKLLPLILDRVGSNSIQQVIWKNAEDTESVLASNIPRHARLVSSWLLTRKKAVLKKSIRYARKLGLPDSFMMQCAGSVFAISFWAHSIGYKRIIFAGIDLNGSKYFFVNNPAFEHLAIPNPLEHETREVSSSKHATNDPEIGIPMEDALMVLQKETGIEMITLSSETALANFLPVFSA